MKLSRIEGSELSYEREFMDIQDGRKKVKTKVSVLIENFMGILKGKTVIKLFKNYPALKCKPPWSNHL